MQGDDWNTPVFFSKKKKLLMTLCHGKTQTMVSGILLVPL